MLTRIVLAGLLSGLVTQQSLPAGPLVIRAFTLRFDPAGTFTLSGDGLAVDGRHLDHERPRSDPAATERARGLHGAGRYTFSVDGARVSFALVEDDLHSRGG